MNTLSAVLVSLLALGCELRSASVAPSPPVETATIASAPAASVPVPSARAAQAIAAARSYIGTPYAWAGRNTEGQPGLDCLGILYLAWGSVTDTPWQKYPVDPSLIVDSRMLGEAVPGLGGVLRERLDTRLLQPGDVLYFLLAGHRIPDEPLWVHQGVQYWPWLTGLYIGEADGLALHASPSGGVMEQPLDEVVFDALYVTRP